MNKGLILSLGLLLVGGVVWFALSSKGGTDSPTSAGEKTLGPARSGDAGTAKLQAPPTDGARAADSAANAADANNPGAQAAAANRAPAAVAPPPPPQFIQGTVAASLDETHNLDATFADRYAKVDMAGRLAKLDELTKTYEEHLQGTRPSDTKGLDEQQLTELQLEIAWLTANPGG